MSSQAINGRRFLFICGTARSGTTALTRIINRHGLIGIGMERFKKIMTRPGCKDQLVPELFDEARFFDFEDGLTNILPSNSDAMHRYYDEMRRKFPDLAYVGDKVPNSFRTVEHIHEHFPYTKYLFIVRDIFETACSWQARAERAADAWSPDKGAAVAVRPWNETNLTYLKMKRAFPDDFHLVDYHEFFNADPEDYTALDDLCEFLELEPDSRMRGAYAGALQHNASKVRAKQRELDPETLRFIAENADLETYRLVGGRALVDGSPLKEYLDRAA